MFSLAAVCAATMMATPAQAGNRCDAPSPGGEARACAAYRDDGPDGLRHFVERTRMIYGLYYTDLARPESDAVAARDAKAPDVAARNERPNQQASNR
jgi:hypothetical protein